jgi:hypothetical protein
MMQTKAQAFRFEEDVLQPKIDPDSPAPKTFSTYWQRALSSLLLFINTLASSRNTGLTGPVATGTIVKHGLAKTPLFVTLVPQDGAVTGYFADTFTVTTFTLHYTGGGTHSFGWSAET